MLYEFNDRHPDFFGIRFCARALRQDDRRNHVSRLYIEDNEMIATDGCRLHTYSIKTMLPNGFYRVLENIFEENEYEEKTKSKLIIFHEKDNQHSFPDYKQLYELFQDIELSQDFDADFSPCGPYPGICKTVRKMPSGRPINTDYLKDLKFHFTIRIIYDEDLKESIRKGMVLFVNEDKTAIIMPMKI